MKTLRINAFSRTWLQARVSRRAAVGGAGLAAIGVAGAGRAAAQKATPVVPGVVMPGHPLVGGWLISVTNPPAGGASVLTAVGSFTNDGNALVSGFGDPSLQGIWVADGSHEATVTVVAPRAGGAGELDRLRLKLETATDNGPFRGTYSFDIVRADGTVAYTQTGSIGGRRVEAQAPDPLP